jgi:hypothetical protein
MLSDDPRPPQRSERRKPRRRYRPEHDIELIAYGVRPSNDAWLRAAPTTARHARTGEPGEGHQAMKNRAGQVAHAIIVTG